MSHFLDLAKFWILLDAKSEFVTSQMGSKCAYLNFLALLWFCQPNDLTNIKFEANALLFSDISNIGIWSIMGRYGSESPFQKTPGDFLLPHFQMKKNVFSLKLTYRGTKKSRNLVGLDNLDSRETIWLSLLWHFAFSL